MRPSRRASWRVKAPTSAAPYRESIAAQPAVVAFPVPAPACRLRKDRQFPIDESLPDVIAAWIDWLVRESDWTVTERERPGERVKVEPRHVCLLFRESAHLWARCHEAPCRSTRSARAATPFGRWRCVLYAARKSRRFEWPLDCDRAPG